MLMTFQFKGDRDYVTGADIFDYIVKALHDEYVIDLSFRKTIKTNCELVTTPPEESYGVIKTNLGTYWLVARESQVSDRVNFDESDLLENSKVEGDSVEMILNTNYSYIENVVVLTKKLNNYLDNPSSGQWMFAQYKSQDDHTKSKGKLTVTSSKRYAGKFSENIVYLDGNEIAKVYFIVG